MVCDALFYIGHGGYRYDATGREQMDTDLSVSSGEPTCEGLWKLTDYLGTALVVAPDWPI